MIRETTAPQDITWLKIDEVYPYECNNKIHNQPEITKIVNSIKEFGWTYPILIDENNIVLAGHKRLLAAKQIGLTEVPTIRKDDLSDAQKRAYRIIDNKSSEESEYDPTNLKFELDEIKALDFDISKFINLDFDFFSDDEEESDGDGKYEQSVKAPIYEIRGENPNIKELCDETRTNELLEIIENSNLDDEEKYFLRLAAYRFLKFSYSKCAEFYAHANGEMKDIMEKLALVIIDYNKAIENGFISLNEELLNEADEQ
jgi:hypothetical protein